MRSQKILAYAVTFPCIDLKKKYNYTWKVYPIRLLHFIIKRVLKVLSVMRILFQGMHISVFSLNAIIEMKFDTLFISKLNVNFTIINLHLFSISIKIFTDYFFPDYIKKHRTKCDQVTKRLFVKQTSQCVMTCYLLFNYDKVFIDLLTTIEYSNSFKYQSIWYIVLCYAFRIAIWSF